MSKRFMERMVLVYGAPESDDPPEFMREYARMLKDYRDDVLDAAMDRLLRTRKFKTWPTIAECLTAADDVITSRARSVPRSNETIGYPERADAVLKTELATRAANEGWVLGLYDFVRESGKTPRDFEIHELMDSAKYVDRCAAGTIDMGVAHSALLQMARKMIIRREGLARTVLGLPPMTDAETEAMR